MKVHVTIWTPAVIYTKTFSLSDFGRIPGVGENLELFEDYSVKVSQVKHKLYDDKYTIIRANIWEGLSPHSASQYDKNGWERTPQY